MKNTIKTIFRNFTRKPAINFINIFGLAISLVLVIILSTYCYSELTSDSHHVNKDRVFLIRKSNNFIHTPASLKEQIDLQLPGVKASIRLADTWNAPVFQAEEGRPIESDMIFTDPAFFELFTYNTIQGNTDEAFKNPLSVVITKTLANKLFGDKHVVGETIKYNNGKLLTVTAVIEEPVENSFLHFSALTSIETRKILQPSSGEFKEWGSNNFQTFVLLNEHVNSSELANKVFSLYPEDSRKRMEGINLIPLQDIYFSNSKMFGSSYFRLGDKNKALILLLVAVLILVIALVNFINITSSQWIEKIKSIGIYKVIGASKIKIFQHILSETFLLFLSATILAILIVLGVVSIIQRFTGITFNADLILSFGFFSIVFVLTIVFSLLISIVPGLRISSSKAVHNINQNSVGLAKNSIVRNSLITLQFVISIVLISFTTLIFKQVDFGSNNLALNQENTIAIKLTKQLKKNILSNELKSYPEIKKMSFTQYYPGKELSNWGTMLQFNGEEYKFQIAEFSADEAFFDISGLQLLKGRIYSQESPSDKNKVVVNETFLKTLKIENPVGGTFEMSGGKTYEIVGVVKDFHFESVEKPIEPLGIINEGYASYCLANIEAKDFQALRTIIQNIKAKTSKLSPEFPVEISFLDEAVNQIYVSEVRFRRTFSLFAISAIILCSVGILAMSIFASQRRTKEIGVRKVNGAKVSEILTMLNEDFIKWVAIAFVIATPIAYYAMNKWLENFAYKTPLSWWIFALAGLLALSIALLTVSWQSWRAATRNPVEALRYE